MNMEANTETRTIAFRVPCPTAEDMEQYARECGFLNISELMRHLWREDARRRAGEIHA